MDREDAATLTGLGFTASELAELGLDRPAVGGAERLLDVYIRRSKKREDLATLLTGPDGKPVSCGTGVVTLAEWYAIRPQVSSRTFPGARGRHEARKPGKLLTGILRCPRCGVDMVSGGTTYRCRTSLGGGPAACPGVRAKVSRADEAVSEAWIRRVSALEPDDPVLHEIARRWLRYQDPESEERRRQAVVALDDAKRRAGEPDDAYYLHGRMSADRHAALSAALAEQIEILETELAALQTHAD